MKKTNSKDNQKNVIPSKHLTIDSPIGKLTITEHDGFITHIYFNIEIPSAINESTSPLLLETAKQLNEYFAGTRKTFDIPLNPQGGPFLQKVWHIMTTGLPFGTTTTYSELATLTGNSKASRAVGMANNRNPIPIIIPCHRVVGKNGNLTGFRGGLSMKEILLAHEKGN